MSCQQEGHSFTMVVLGGTRDYSTRRDNQAGGWLRGLWRQNREYCEVVGVWTWAATAETVGGEWRRTINEGWVEAQHSEWVGGVEGNLLGGCQRENCSSLGKKLYAIKNKTSWEEDSESKDVEQRLLIILCLLTILALQICLKKVQ